MSSNTARNASRIPPTEAVEIPTAGLPVYTEPATAAAQDKDTNGKNKLFRRASMVVVAIVLWAASVGFIGWYAWWDGYGTANNVWDDHTVRLINRHLADKPLLKPPS